MNKNEYTAVITLSKTVTVDRPAAEDAVINISRLAVAAAKGKLPWYLRWGNALALEAAKIVLEESKYKRLLKSRFCRAMITGSESLGNFNYVFLSPAARNDMWVAPEIREWFDPVSSVDMIATGKLGVILGAEIHLVVDANGKPVDDIPYMTLVSTESSGKGFADVKEG